MNLLNVGCGARFHPAWTNIDLEPSSPEIKRHDIRRGLPFADESFDACYSSHVLEHIGPRDVQLLLREMYRVLRFGGVIRCVVPDLEGMAKMYLRTTNDLAAGIPGAEANHDWMIIELYDQTVRSAPGGEMSRYLNRPQIPNAEFVRSRIGDLPDTEPNAQKRSFWNRIRRNGFQGIWRRCRVGTARLMVRLIAGAESQRAFDEGSFRTSGEVHRWMYDCYSLGQLLESVGFRDVRVCTATESRIANFASYELDAVGGRPLIPQSLFLEAIKS